jgi:hypothetical protein
MARPAMPGTAAPRSFEVPQTGSTPAPQSKLSKGFPRFVQHAIWRYCAADGLNLCNGNRINDRERCQTNYCHLFEICGRKPLKSDTFSDV